MVSVDDILFHVAQRYCNYSGQDIEAAIEEFIFGYRFDLHVAITDDLEATEEIFLSQFGMAETFYFRLADYEHGKILAGQMYRIFLGTRPEMDAHTGDRFTRGKPLYLFVHVAAKPEAVASTVESA